MKRALLFGAALMLIGTLGLIYGCGDDNPTESTKVPGDPNDPVFLNLQDGFAELDETVAYLLDFSMVVLDTVFEEQGNPSPAKWTYTGHSLGTEADSFFLTYHSQSQYWYAYASFDSTVDTTTIMAAVLEDSVQFLHGFTPVQWPDSALLTGFNAGGSVAIEQTGAGTIEMGQRFSVVGDLPNMGDITINGDGQMVAAMSSVEPDCDFSFNMAHWLSNIEANLTELQAGDQGACPTAGRIRYYGAMHLSCTGDTSFTYNDSWTVTQTFNGNQTVTVRVENSTTYWETTESCGPVASPAIAGAVREFLDVD